MSARVSLYSNIKQTRGGDTTDIDLFISDVKSGKWSNNIIDYRTGKIPKTALPYVTISGEFTERKIAGLKEHSGFICIDIDKVDPNEVKELLCADKYTYACWTSVSGAGVAALFRINPKKHAESFDGLSEYLFSQYQIIVDPSGRDVCRARFISYDPELYHNPGAAKFTKYPQQKQAIKKLPKIIYVQNDFDDIINQITSRNIDLVDSYQDWRNVAFALTDKFGEGGRNYFHLISRISNKYKPDKCDKQYTACLKHNGSGITIATLYYLAKQAGIATISAKTKLIGTAAAQAKKGGRNAADTVTLLKNVEGIPEQESEGIVKQVFENNIDFDAEDGLVCELEIWLRQNYNFRRNVINRKIDNGGAPMEGRHFNSIFIQAKKMNDKTTFDLIERIINSDFTPDYNPLKDFIKINKERKPSGCIKALCDTIISDMPRQYIELFITKWLVGIIQSIEDEFSSLMLVLSGSKQNTGKTTWFRRLLPREIRQYYAESKLDAGKDDEILMCQKIIIMDDEMGGKSKRDADKLKTLTSKKWFTLREPYGRGNVDLRRLAVLCGTSNDEALLNDPTGNRRILPIRVLDIDKEAYNEIDKTDLFIEAYHLYEAKYTAELTSDEIAYLAENTVDFQAVSVERELIQKYLDHPTGTHDTRFMTATDIKVELEKYTQQRININKLGHELRNAGYNRTAKKISGVTAYGYEIKDKGYPAI